MDRIQDILGVEKHDFQVYGVFEGALLPELWLEVDYWQLPYAILYEGNSDQIVEVAPYLIELNPGMNSKAVALLLQTIGQNASFFIQSTLTLGELLNKLRHFYHILGEDGRPLLSRFYDPRIFPMFLDSMQENKRELLFDGVVSFLHETPQNQLVQYRRDQSRLITTLCPLEVEHAEVV